MTPKFNNLNTWGKAAENRNYLRCFCEMQKKFLVLFCQKASLTIDLLLLLSFCHLLFCPFHLPLSLLALLCCFFPIPCQRGLLSSAQLSSAASGDENIDYVEVIWNMACFSKRACNTGAFVSFCWGILSSEVLWGDCDFSFICLCPDHSSDKEIKFREGKLWKSILLKFILHLVLQNGKWSKFHLKTMSV